MKKFLVIYHAPASLQKAINKMSAEQRSEGMKAWMNWFNSCGSSLVEMGQPLINGKALSKGKSVANSKKNATGYSILQAKDMKEANAILKNHPHTAWSKQASIEVHEMMPIQGM